MENSSVGGEYGLVGLLLVLTVVVGVLGVLAYAGLKLSLKNPDDIP